MTDAGFDKLALPIILALVASIGGGIATFLTEPSLDGGNSGRRYLSTGIPSCAEKFAPDGVAAGPGGPLAAIAKQVLPFVPVNAR
jgi:hypothetical protein